MVVIATPLRGIPIIRLMVMMAITIMGSLFTVHRISSIADIVIGATGLGAEIAIGAIGAGGVTTIIIVIVVGVVIVATVTTSGVGGAVTMVDIGASNAIGVIKVMAGVGIEVTRVAGVAITAAKEGIVVTGMVIIEPLSLTLVLGFQSLVVSLTDQAKALYRADGSGTHDRLFARITA